MSIGDPSKMDQEGSRSSSDEKKFLFKSLNVKDNKWNL